MKVNLRLEGDLLVDLRFDDRRCDNPRLNNFMLNKPMSKWIMPSGSRHVVWKGFLLELSEVLNSREFTFHFVGTASAFEQFKENITRELPSNFTADFSLDELDSNPLNVDVALTDEIVSLLKDDNLPVARQLRLIRDAVDIINCQIIYERHGEAAFFQWLLDYPLQFQQTNALAISMPLILISDKELAQDPCEICKSRKVEPKDVMILAVKGDNPKVMQQVARIKQTWGNLNVFSLTGDLEKDKPELTSMRHCYNSFKRKKLRALIANCPNQIWKDVPSIEQIISRL